MIITCASAKGGVGKTTSAIHLAAYFATLGPTLLLDADKTRNALSWAEAGPGLPFEVAPISQATKLVPKYAAGHIVLDTGQRLEGDDLREAVEGCDLLVVPAVPGSLDTRSLVQTIQALRKMGTTKYRVLLARVPPTPEREGQLLRSLLVAEDVPIFKGEIPRLKAFERAAANGLIVDQVADPNAYRAWETYCAVGREILQ